MEKNMCRRPFICVNSGKPEQVQKYTANHLLRQQQRQEDHMVHNHNAFFFLLLLELPADTAGSFGLSNTHRNLDAQPLSVCKNPGEKNKERIFSSARFQKALKTHTCPSCSESKATQTLHHGKKMGPCWLSSNRIEQPSRLGLAPKTHRLNMIDSVLKQRGKAG